jgi:hypothetical protein
MELLVPLFFLVIIFMVIVGGPTPIGRRLSPRVTITVTPNYFVFDSGKSSFQLDTYLYVTRESNQVAAVGEKVDGSDCEDVFRVDLFKCGNLYSEKVDRLLMLQAFVNYGILKSLGQVRRFPIISPTVIFRGVEAFDSLFCGYQRGLFQLAVPMKTMDVIFE